MKKRLCLFIKIRLLHKTDSYNEAFLKCAGIFPSPTAPLTTDGADGSGSLENSATAGTDEIDKELSEKFQMQLIASGGVSSLDDVKKLNTLGIYGAIIGKAYYTGAIDLKEAIEVAK